ncbi:MAG: hypothetical protein JW769_01185 [Parachlamydiales bacterium]|nr:hypothetical protein [Parachlamydiales bacterium]
MVEKVGPTESSKKQDKTTAPDSKRFQDFMKIDQTPEISPDERKKKRPKQLEEENAPLQTVYQKPSTTPQPQESHSPKITTAANPSSDRITDSGILKNMMDQKTKEEEESHLPSSLEGTFGTIKMSKIQKKKIQEEQKKVLSEVTGTSSSLESQTIQKKEDDRMKKISETYQQIASIPLPIQERAAAITGKIAPYLDPELQPLFEKLIGSLIYVSKEGIERTQVTLNSPAFATSRFYGTTITIERYATAPDSFNITLRGNPAAVTLFNANIGNLLQSLQKSNQNFRIGQLVAEHEEVIRPLVRRKKRLGHEGSGVD